MHDAVSELAPTGTLRAAINLGNPVLVQGTGRAPRGIAVELAEKLASRLRVPVEFHCFDAAPKAAAAVMSQVADLGFLAIEPAREEHLDFTAPYVILEGIYAVRFDSPIMAVNEVDVPGRRVAVRDGSAYDLFLSRTLGAAVLERGSDLLRVMRESRADAIAGVRQPVEAAAAISGLRVLEPPFMAIRQAIAVAKGLSPTTLQFLRAWLEEMRASGFVSASLRSNGISSEPTVSEKYGDVADASDGDPA